MEYQNILTLKCSIHHADRICDILNKIWGKEADAHWIGLTRGGDDTKPISIDFYVRRTF